MSLRAVLQNPEYTGTNRCLPCTAVNGVIALCLSGVLGLGVMRVATVGAGIAVFGLALGVSVSVIWLRGYVIPGTPTVTKRYLPARVLTWFGKDVPQSGDDPLGDREPETILRAAGVLEPCPEEDDLCLTDSFAQAWNDELASVADEPDPQTVLAELGIGTRDLTVVQHDDAVVVHDQNGRKVGQWPSPTALRLDIAAAPVIAARVPEWGSLSPSARSQLVAAVRIFLDECPDKSPVEVTSTTVESCCSSYEVVSVRCTGNGDRLFEQQM